MPEKGERRLQTALKSLEAAEDISDINKNYIKKFIQQLSAEGISKSRRTKYIFYLKRLVRMLKKDFNKADRTDIIHLSEEIENGYSLWIKRKNKPLSEWAKHDFRVTIKRFYKWLRESEGQEFARAEYPHEVKWLTVNMKRERKKLPRQLLDEKDLEKLLNQTTNARDRCFVYLLWESGCRIGELLNLQLRDIAPDEYGVRLTVHGKTGERVIRIIDAAPTIIIWKKEHPKSEEGDSYLFCGLNGVQRGKPIDYNYFRILLHKLAKKGNMNKPVNPHHFRHSGATRLAKQLTEAQLCEYMGWVQGSQEARTYVHLSGRDLDEAILTIHGKKEKKKEETRKEPKTCPRCKTVNDPLAKFCSSCSLGLDKKSVMEYDELLKEKDNRITELERKINYMESRTSDEVVETMFEKQKAKLLEIIFDELDRKGVTLIKK